MNVDLCVINYHTYSLLQRFIDSYYKFKPQHQSKLIVVDVESKDDIDNINTYDAEVVRRKDNCGYARACNLAAVHGEGDVVAFFNADTAFIDDTCVDRCIDFLGQNPQVAVVGPLQISSQGRVTHGGIFGSLAHPQHRGWLSTDIKRYQDDRNAVTVSGSAFFVRRSVWQELSLCPIFRERYPLALGAFLPTPHFFEETWCAYHAQAHGYEVWYLGSAKMIHEWHKSSPVGSQSKNFDVSQQMFRDICDAHGMVHD